MSVLDEIAVRATQLMASHPRVLVGIDGPDASGKTTFADRLAERLTVPTVRASIDSFHNPAAVRKQRGELSPEGYYLDSFDYTGLTTQLLAPFRDGAHQVGTQQFDYRTDEAMPADSFDVPTGAVLIFDGVFLLRPELRDWWTLSVYLHVPPEITLERALTRDLDQFGSPAEVERRYTARYLPGQALYRAESSPETTADVVIDNSNHGEPAIVRGAS